MAKATQKGLEPSCWPRPWPITADPSTCWRSCWSSRPTTRRSAATWPRRSDWGTWAAASGSAFRPQEAESLYRRAIEIRRELLCGVSSGRRCRRPAAARRDRRARRPALPGKHGSSRGRDAGRQGPSGGSRELRRQLEDDIVAVAARLSEPKFQDRAADVGRAAHIGAASPLRHQPDVGMR